MDWSWLILGFSRTAWIELQQSRSKEWNKLSGTLNKHTYSGAVIAESEGPAAHSNFIGQLCIMTKQVFRPPLKFVDDGEIVSNYVGPPINWKRPVGHPRHTWLRAVTSDLWILDRTRPGEGLRIETDNGQGSKWTGTPFRFVKCIGNIVSFRLNAIII